MCTVNVVQDTLLWYISVVRKLSLLFVITFLVPFLFSAFVCFFCFNVKCGHVNGRFTETPQKQ